MPQLSSPSQLRAWLKLGVCAGSLWAFFAFFSPWISSQFDAWRHYVHVQEEYGLDSGALYYTNVPVSYDCEVANREAVRSAMEARKNKTK